jgi:hypothetical protein
MSLRRYHSVYDMPRPIERGDIALLVRIRELWRRAFLLSPPHYKKGVSRFRSIDEANAKRDADRIEYMRARRRQVFDS